MKKLSPFSATFATPLLLSAMVYNGMFEWFMMLCGRMLVNSAPSASNLEHTWLSMYGQDILKSTYRTPNGKVKNSRM